MHSHLIVWRIFWDWLTSCQCLPLVSTLRNMYPRRTALPNRRKWTFGRDDMKIDTQNTVFSLDDVLFRTPATTFSFRCRFQPLPLPAFFSFILSSFSMSKFFTECASDSSSSFSFSLSLLSLSSASSPIFFLRHQRQNDYQLRRRQSDRRR